MTEITRKGFTLIELLIVIAILGVLAAAVTIVLNPAELLAQARDGQRISDMDTIRTAVSTYLSQATSTPNLDAVPFGTAGGCSFANGTSTAPFNGSAAACTAPSAVNMRTVSGAGWVDVNFSGLPGGSPLATLPVDPVNVTTYTYAYVGNNTVATPNYTFKLATRLESVKFRSKMNLGPATGAPTSCSTGIEQTCWYQVGTNLGL
jgi:prepilin-type N-terminal cleavage/methylation domain-containing protein